MNGPRPITAPPYEVGDGIALSSREQQILTLIGQGKSTKEIAADLGISFKTVVTHRSHIQVKTRSSNTADLTRAAIRLGLVRP